MRKKVKISVEMIRASANSIGAVCRKGSDARPGGWVFSAMSCCHSFISLFLQLLCIPFSTLRIMLWFLCFLLSFYLSKLSFVTFWCLSPFCVTWLLKNSVRRCNTTKGRILLNKRVQINGRIKTRLDEKRTIGSNEGGLLK